MQTIMVGKAWLLGAAYRHGSGMATGHSLLPWVKQGCWVQTIMVSEAWQLGTACRGRQGKAAGSSRGCGGSRSVWLFKTADQETEKEPSPLGNRANL